MGDPDKVIAVLGNTFNYATHPVRAVAAGFAREVLNQVLTRKGGLRLFLGKLNRI